MIGGIFSGLMINLQIKGVTYLVETVCLEKLQTILLGLVPHPEVISPHLDLALVQPSLLLDGLNIIRVKPKVPRGAGKHHTL